MSLPARPTPPPRPDPEALLLAAIRHRDPQITSRLVGQWVHRRGMASLDTFRRLTLRSAEGEEACRWLERQLDSPPIPAAPSEQPATPPAGEDPEEWLPVASSPGPAALLEPEHPTEGPSVMPLPAHLASLAAIDPWAVPVPMSTTAAEVPGPVSTVPADSAVHLTGIGAEPLPLPGPPEPLALDHAPPPPAVPKAAAPTGWKRRFGFAFAGLARGRRSLTGAGSLMRDCLEEALGSFQPAALDGEFHPEPPQAAPAPAEEPLGSAAAVPAQPEPEHGISTSPSSTEPTTARVTFDSPRPPQGGESPLDVAPLPLFARGTDPRSTPPASPFRLTRLREGLPEPGEGERAAPAPDALADLRAWLPDSGDLPKVC